MRNKNEGLRLDGLFEVLLNCPEDLQICTQIDLPHHCLLQIDNLLPPKGSKQFFQLYQVFFQPRNSPPAGCPHLELKKLVVSSHRSRVLDNVQSHLLVFAKIVLFLRIGPLDCLQPLKHSLLLFRQLFHHKLHQLHLHLLDLLLFGTDHLPDPQRVLVVLVLLLCLIDEAIKMSLELF